ncbi:MAG: DUF1566 domain-containing protein, partial [Nitrospirae bacterium]|nr:DUF1566 domain-containing protein [Nitrospirota bacterium]
MFQRNNNQKMKYLQLHGAPGVRVLFTLMLVAVIGAMCLNSAAYAGTVSLPKTGQSKCYDQSGNAINCAGTGQDGDLRKGVAWPNPRITDNGDQTLTDNLTGLVWTVDTSTPTSGTCTGGKMIRGAALNYVSCLNKANYLGYNDWRLPNINELKSIANSGVYVQSANYWSSTTYYDGGSAYPSAFIVNMGDVSMGTDQKSTNDYVWPVRTGQTGAISLPQTGQKTCYDANNNTISCTGTGEDGELQK